MTHRLPARFAAAVVLVVCSAALLVAEPQSGVERIPIPNSDFPISQGVWVPSGYDTLYLSGSIPPVSNPSAPKGSTQSYGDTQAQTVAVLKRIEQTLASQCLSIRCSSYS